MVQAYENSAEQFYFTDNVNEENKNTLFLLDGDFNLTAKIEVDVAF